MNNKKDLISKIIKKKHLFFLIAMFFIVSVFFYICNYGFAGSDESFYLSIAYRLISGDKLIFDEWHPTQFGLSILYPFVKMFLLAHGGNTEGIILFFRRLYLVISFILTCLFYVLLERKGYKYSAFISILYFIFVPFSLSCLSYFSIPYLIINVGCLLYINFKNNFIFFIVGIIYSICVLCCPYLAIPYLIYAIAILLLNINKKISKQQKKLFKFSLCGIMFMALIYLILVFHNTDYSKLPLFVKFVLNDPTHEVKGVIYTLYQYFSYIFKNKYSLFAYSLIYACYTAFAIDKNILRKNIYFIIYIILSFLMLIMYRNINLLMIPLSFLGLFAYSYEKNDRSKELYFLYYIPGLIYSICINLASNQGSYAVSCAMAVMTISGLLMFLNIEKNDSKKIYRLTQLAFLICLSTMFIKITYYRTCTFFADNISTAAIELNNGPEKGIRVSKEKADIYYQDYINIKSINREKTLYLDTNSWVYLYDNVRICSPSAWLSGGVNDKTIARLDEYYKIHNTQPEVVIIKNDNKHYAYHFIKNYNYNKINILETGAIILQK